MISIDAGDVRRFAGQVKGDSQRALSRVQAITQYYGQLLLTRVQANASGRPGPRVITGNYRRSWTLDFAGSPTGASASAGTNAPQAQRLEFGFVGVDSLGRHVSAPPYPHANPALDTIGPQYEQALADLTEEP